MLQRPLPANHERRKALLIGINYTDSQHAQLKGCINDVWNVHCLLRHTLRFSEDQIRLLVDGENGMPAKDSRRPTRENIAAGLEWLVADARPGDGLLLLFCGFGAQHPSAPGAEAHEAYLVPADFAADLPGGLPPGPEARPACERGYRLVPLLELSHAAARLPAGSRLTVLLDCAYPLLPGLGPEGPAASFPRVPRGRVDYRKLQDFVSRPRFLELPPLPVRHTPPHLCAPPPPACALHCFAACGLGEWDAELPLEGTVQGAFTWALTKALAAGRFRCSATALQESLQRTTHLLKQHFKGVGQTPVLTLSQAATGEDIVFGA
mmetsp:Transcript_92273/g.287188  ORF Transcript_92273/g.287188 Transcript_92273/m.287188 type:complete len:322 (+) Transcript_92273:1-966(+)